MVPAQGCGGLVGRGWRVGGPAPFVVEVATGVGDGLRREGEPLDAGAIGIAGLNA